MIMTRGKNICKQLKEVRKRIAEENGIPLKIEECSYKGECRGTCPRCEAEVRYLENALAERLRIGKVATVAGLALGLATAAQAQAPQNDTVPLLDTAKAHKAECLGTLKGTVFDIKTNEPLPFVNIVLKQDGKQIHVGTTDFDGHYTLKPVPFGDYTLIFMYAYHRRIVHGVTVNRPGFTVTDIGMVYDSTIVIDSCSASRNHYPPIEIGNAVGTAGEVIRQVRYEDDSENDREVVHGQIQVKLPGTPASQATPAEQPLLYEEKEHPGVRVKMLSVAALALGLAAGTAQAAGTSPTVLPEVPSIVTEAVHVSDSVTIKGTVVESGTGEPVPFARVVVADGKGMVVGTNTDFDGNYEVKVAKGKYTITFACVGYAEYVMPEDMYKKDCLLPSIKLESSITGLVEVEIIDDRNYQPVIEIGPDGASQSLEKDGVKVIVR